MAMACASFAQGSWKTAKAEISNKYGFTKKNELRLAPTQGQRAKTRDGETAYDILGCKEGSVGGNELTEETGWSGQWSADAGRPDMGRQFFQHFDDVFYTFNKVRFLGVFNYWNDEDYDWLYCFERGGMDENQNMTEPVMFEVAVYEEGEDGMPGKCILKKDMPLIGKNTGVITGYEPDMTPIYEFTADLGEEISLEHGYIQFNAKDMGDSPSCWYAAFCAGNDGSYAYTYDFINEEYSDNMPACFCLYGDGVTRNAKKALQLERFVMPGTSANGKYEKVQVELFNIGENAISDAKLELYVDDKLVATEDVNVTLEPFDTYKYTFTARANCAEGKKITVKNVTPGDEKKSQESISMTLSAPVAGEYPECYGILPDIIKITKVSLGEINNESEGSSYTDFTDKTTTIHPGETLDLNVTVECIDYEPSLGVYIDWNNDYQFSYDEKVQFDTYEADDNGGKGVGKVTVPSFATAGPHRMRVVATVYYYDPLPNDYYYRGECEDYTVIVEPAGDAPLAAVDKDIIDQPLSGNTETASFGISNTGKSTLTSNISFDYILPGLPSNITAAPANKSKFNAKFHKAGKANAKRMAPAKTGTADYVLRYDADNNDCIGLGNAAEAIFASLYPGSMLANIEGMTINSVDVYIGDVPESASIVLYGQKTQTACGELLCEQAFTPVEHSWNHVELATPVTVGATDIWVGVKMGGMTARKYYIGVDEGPAKVGFGDLVNIGGNYWWSMADLGLNYNYNIRANVTGTRTPAINWMAIDKQTVEVAPASTENINVSFDATNLKEGVYEAYIEIVTDDPLCGYTNIPVYMVKGEGVGVSTIRGDKPAIVLNNGAVSVKTGKAIASITVTDLNGRTVLNEAVNADAATADLNSFGKGIYVVSVRHTDGTKVSMKVPVVK